MSPDPVSKNDLPAALDACLRRLFPINRSITGRGNRETLEILREVAPITVHEVPSGTAVYDWTVPPEWNVRDAWIAGPDGRRIVDFQASNLHLVSYSEPVRATLNWEELAPHLHVHPTLPDAIPYRTSYYRRGWGFCVTHAQHRELKSLGGPLEVVIDSEFNAEGSLTYGECLIPGRSAEEILLSCYICHPSMANDSLSGVVLAAFVARELLARSERRYSYRVVFVPETIGAIAYCASNEAAMKRIDMGLVLTTAGGPGRFGYKQSFDASHALNGMIEAVFRERNIPFLTYPFDIHGSDERQYSSQAFRINVATICKDRYYEYPEYHSSADDLDFVTGKQLAESLELYLALIDKIEARRIYRSRMPSCEVMLSKRGLYPVGGGHQLPELGGRSELDLVLWLLFLCDGKADIDQICRQLGIPAVALNPIAEHLVAVGLMEVV